MVWIGHLIVTDFYTVALHIWSISLYPFDEPLYHCSRSEPGMEVTADLRLGRHAWCGIPGSCTFYTPGYGERAAFSLSQPHSVHYFHCHIGHPGSSRLNTSLVDPKSKARRQIHHDTGT